MVRSIMTILLMAVLFMGGTLIGFATVMSPPTVELPRALHFLTPSGDDIVLGPGTYELEALEQDLQLKPKDGKAEDSNMIKAKALPHADILEMPKAVTEPIGEDALRVALLLSDGTGLETVGSYSGQTQVKPRSITRPSVNLRETEDPYHEINEAVLVNGSVTKFSVTPIPRQAFGREPIPKGETPSAGLQPPGDKLHPLVKEWLSKRSGQERELVVITFQDDVKIPRFPEPAMDEPRDSATNKRAHDRARELIRGIRAQRATGYEKRAQELAAAHGAKVHHEFWLTNAMLADLPLGAVNGLAKRSDVLYIEPHSSLDKPPQNSNTSDDVDDGRARIASDQYFNLNLTGGFIGLLDTGLRFTHTQFTNPDHIDFQYDCVNGGADCNNTAAANFNATDDCWNHGTSSAGIITGNTTQGGQYRGVTAIRLDSLKVYPNGCIGLNDTAAVRGFERAVEIGDRVIVAEMQGSGSYSSAVSTAADAAFDAGAVVIAANGNNGPASGTVNSPANAHKVIGVGAFNIQTLTQYASQSRGPTSDNRIKPDVQAPTDSETASAATNTALRNFGGTSGATPYAAGAAALLRNFLRGTSANIDPGHVYAHLILSGQQPFPFNNTTGAGPLRLLTNGSRWWGKTTVYRMFGFSGSTVDIPIKVAGGQRILDAAAWWPESLLSHLGIEVYLIDPGGTTRASSTNSQSIFQRARVSTVTQLTTGVWRLRIRAASGFASNQQVYWAASSESLATGLAP